MIIVFAGSRSDMVESMLAASLAALCTKERHKVLLVDGTPQRYAVGWTNRRRIAGLAPAVPVRTIAGKSMQPELENLSLHFDDILIDTEARDCMASRSALVMAHVAVVCVRADLNDTSCRENLIARLETARLFNPGLRMILAPLCAAREAPWQARDAADALAACIPGAQLTGEILCESASLHQAFSGGLSVTDRAFENHAFDSGLKRIFTEVFGDAPKRRAFLPGILHRIHRVAPA